jgi:hypothetical protein
MFIICFLVVIPDCRQACGILHVFSYWQKGSPKAIGASLSVFPKIRGHARLHILNNCL